MTSLETVLELPKEGDSDLKKILRMTKKMMGVMIEDRIYSVMGGIGMDKSNINQKK